MKRPTIILLIFYLIGIFFYSQSIDILAPWKLTIISIFIVLSYLRVKDKKLFILSLTFLFIGFLLSYRSDKTLLLDDEVERRFYGLFTVVEQKPAEFNNIYHLKEKKTGLKFLFKSQENFLLGSRLLVEGKIRRIKSQDNFYLFNYKKNLASQRIFNEIKGVKVKKIKGENSLLRLKYRINSYLEDNLRKIDDKKASSLLINIVLGKNLMDKEDLQVYRDLGLAHVLAVSGLHINILIFILDSMGAYLTFNKKYYFYFIIAVILFYGYLISFPVSLQRSLFSYIIGQVAIYREKIEDSLNTWSFSALLILIINPFYIYSAGFWLSFGASFSLIYLYEKMKVIFISKNKYFNSFLLILTVQIGLLPLQIYYFNRINFMSFLSNFLLISLMEALIVMAFFLAPGIPFITPILATIIKFIYAFLEECLRILYEFKIFYFSYRSLNIKEMIAYFLILLILINYRKVFRRIKRRVDKFTSAFKSPLLYLCLISLLWIITNRTMGASVKIEFIDVGQGEAIRISSGSQNVFFDLGGQPLNLEKSGEDFYTYLVKRGVKRIDALFISHDDLDHMGNYYYIKGKIPIKKIFIAKENKLNFPAKLEQVSKGEIYKFNNFSMKIILDGKDSSTSNDSSMVILLESFNKKVLLTGDIEEREKLIHKSVNRIDILSVSHHGSKYSTQDEFLDEIGVKEAIISVGQYNRYGHPHKELLDRLEKKKIKIYRTDLHGAIQVVINRKGYRIKTYNKR